MTELFYDLQISVKLGSKLDQKLTTFSYFMSLYQQNWSLKFPLNTFFDQIIICQISFGNLGRQTNLLLNEKVNIWTPSGYSPSFYFIFLLKWNKHEILNKRRQEKDGKL